MPRFKRQNTEYQLHHYLKGTLNELCSEHVPALSYQDLAALTGDSEESFRRVLNGGETTSENLIESAGRVLKLPGRQIRHLLDLNIIDSLERVYGGFLSQEQGQEVSTLLLNYFNQNLPAERPTLTKRKAKTTK